MGNGSHQNKDKKANRRITQHKRFVSFGTYPNSAFGGISFMLEPLVAIRTHDSSIAPARASGRRAKLKIGKIRLNNIP